MQHLGEVLQSWRLHLELGLREAANRIGIGHTTLQRLEKGESCDGETLKRVICWLLESKDA